MLHSFILYFSLRPAPLFFSFFFFNDTATTEIYTLSLHDALPIFGRRPFGIEIGERFCRHHVVLALAVLDQLRSEEHTSELQSHSDLVCRLLLEKKKKLSIHISIR